jgi:hypothetical protein
VFIASDVTEFACAACGKRARVVPGELYGKRVGFFG